MRWCERACVREIEWKIYMQMLIALCFCRRRRWAINHVTICLSSDIPSVRSFACNSLFLPFFSLSLVGASSKQHSHTDYHYCSLFWRRVNCWLPYYFFYSLPTASRSPVLSPQNWEMHLLRCPETRQWLAEGGKLMKNIIKLQRNCIVNVIKSSEPLEAVEGASVDAAALPGECICQ